MTSVATAPASRKLTSGKLESAVQSILGRPGAVSGVRKRRAARGAGLLLLALAAVAPLGAQTDVYTLDGGTSAVDPLDSVHAQVPVLGQNQPNPFEQTTSIAYEIRQQLHVTSKVYDPAGRQVATLFDGIRARGSYEASFAAASLPSGVYLYRLNAGGDVQTRRMIVRK